MVVAAGSAYALDVFGPEVTDPPSTVAEAQTAIAESATLRADLVGEIKEARTVLKSPDGQAAKKSERRTLNSAIDDAQDVVTALESVASSPSGTVSEANAVLELTSALHDDVPVVTTALRDAASAVVASGRQVRRERPTSEVETARGAPQAAREADVEADGVDSITGDSAIDSATDPATAEDASTAAATTAAGTCPEPDQVWSAENGHLSSSELASIPFASSHYVRADVVGGLTDLNAAYAAEFGVNLTINSSYRTYEQQEALYDPTSDTAAPPGCSNHGTGLAIDIGGGVQTFGSAQYDWLKVNAEAYGWVHPPFAEPAGRNPEPWHWQSVQAPNSY